jgi:AraC family transcriptional regulator, transcriptional activator of pobA
VATTRIAERSGNRPAIYTYEPAPGVPAVDVIRLDRSSLGSPQSGPHAHDFPMLTYFERGGGSLRSGSREWRVLAGDAYVIAPGEVVGAGDSYGLLEAEGWGVLFRPEALSPESPSALLSWRAHPLLLPFVRGAGGRVLRLRVPSVDRPVWSERLTTLDRELRERRDGYRQAVVAQLMLLLVGVARLARDVVGDLRVNDEPLLAAVFGVIEERFSERLSLKDVAQAVSLSPGHLTTVVRRRTGRTVQQWITERRMVQARRMLVETDLTVAEIGRRTGYPDPVYFVRSFKRVHGTTPLRWRRAGRT